MSTHPVHFPFVHSLVQMYEQQGDCVETETDVREVQHLQPEAAGGVPGLGLLQRLVDASQVSHPEVSHRGRAPSQLRFERL